MGRRAQSLGHETLIAGREDNMKERYGDISARRDGHVAFLEIDRPPHNYATIALMQSLADALAEIDADKNLRASVLMSAGKNFCAGGDFSAIRLRQCVVRKPFRW